MSIALKIVTATDEDAEACRSVLVAALASSIGVDEPQIVTRIENLEQFHQQDRRRLLGRVDDCTVAFVDFYEDEIAWLMVAPQCQSRGIGAQLLAAAIAQMDPIVSVLCVVSNERAARFYERNGFTRQSGIRSGRMFGIKFDNYVLIHDTTN